MTDDVWRAGNELPEHDLSESPDEALAARFHAEIRASTEPQGALVLATPSGRWLYWRCRRCPHAPRSTWRWPEPEKADAQLAADEHNRTTHPDLAEEATT